MRSFVGCVVLGAALSCASSLRPSPLRPVHPIARGPEPFAVLTVFVMEPVELEIMGHSVPWSAEDTNAARTRLEAALRAVGFKIVDDDDASTRDVVATSGVGCADSGYCTYALALTSQHSAEKLDTTTFTFSCASGDDMNCIRANLDGAIPELVNPLVNSSSIGRLARAKQAGLALSAQASASTTPANAPTPPGPTPAAPPKDAPPTLKIGAPQRTAYAVIVGIDHYRDLPAASGARSDAEHVAALLRTTFGIPESNIRVALDDRATRTDITQLLSWLVGNVPQGGRAYFFYSGHGSPDVRDGSPLLVPYDASAQAIAETALPLAAIYKQLGSSKAKDAIAIIDACFSGAGGRSVLPAGARPLMRVREAEPAASLTIFAAAAGTETSGPASGGGQGVFTKYVLEGVGTGQADVDGDGQITMAELAQWVSPRVTNEARQQSRDQHPRLAVGNGVGDAKNVALVWGVR